MTSRGGSGNLNTGFRVEDTADSPRRMEHPLDRDSVVFDVGGYVGDFAANTHDRFGCRVFVFEPVEEFFDRCQRRFAGNDDVRCFQFGLSARDEEATIYKSGDGTSLFRPGAAGDTDRIRLKSFDSVLEECGIAEVDLLKVNIEGAEYGLLEAMLASGAMARVNFLQVQFHKFFRGADRQRDAIRRRLRETHEEMWNYPFVWESWARRKQSAG